MKKLMLIGAMALAFIGTTTAQFQDGRFAIDYKNSSIEWKAQKVTGSGHTGNVRVSSGLVVVAKNNISSAKLKVDMNAISCTDLTDATYNANLINHLKSEDFFNSAKFPDAQFEATSITPAPDANGNTHLVKGILTVKGIAKEITFPAKVTQNGNQILIYGTAQFNRANYDVRYGSSSFFNDLGDKAINDIVDLTFNLIATKS